MAMIRTNIPQRLDCLPWSRWHWRVVTALGFTWFLDGLEVTIVGALGAVLTHPSTLHLTEPQIGMTASAYLLGSVVGAVVFASLTDRQGRKKWFLLTLLLYLTSTALTAFSWNLESFTGFRFLTGAGIGGEYAAINSAIDELIPARVRGRISLAINGSWWLGTATGALVTIPLLDQELISESIGWRVCFLVGVVLGFGVILIRRHLPESPRWLMTHGRIEEAEQVVRSIEQAVAREQPQAAWPPPIGSITIQGPIKATFAAVARTLIRTYPSRTVLGFILMAAQSFLYNGIFFTYALVLSKFHEVASRHIGLHLVPFAVANFLGPLVLRRWFDVAGRKTMIAMTYGISGLLLAGTGYLFWQDRLNAFQQTLAWAVIFFFASAGASAAYLTVSEIFPIEIRSRAIAIFFVAGQGAGIAAPWLFGHLISRSATDIFFGDLLGAGLMLLGAGAAMVWGVKAERQPLEALAPPLSVRRPQSDESTDYSDDMPDTDEPSWHAQGARVDMGSERDRTA